MKRNDTGKKGEELVSRYLSRNGYDVIVKNFKIKNGEIDIISKNDEYIVFTEVKTRSQNSYTGLDAVDIRKQRHILKTAEYYLNTTGCMLQPRFDTALVIMEDGLPCSLEYIENAFDGESIY